MSSIKAIDSTTIHRLTSGQVIIDLQTAVKELLENALDAGSTSVEIRFKEYGLESIEVVDNGKGIDEADWPGIARKHHTSKLTSFDSLNFLTTLGFRGEALSSLCGTASLSIMTSTASTSPIGTSLSFLPSGECVIGSKVARQKGTSVMIKELFKKLPVRRKELEKNLKREFGKCLELINAYALIEGRVKIDLKNTTKGKSSTHLSTPLSTSSTLDPLRRNFSSLFSPKALAQMMDLSLDLTIIPDKTVLKHSDSSTGETKLRVRGLVSKPITGSGRTSSSRQYFYVNGRPFAPSKIAKAFNEVYKSFNTGSFPSVVADFQLPPDAYDVNVSPDKRTIFLHSEGNLISSLKAALEDLFQPSRSTFAMSQIGVDKRKKVDEVEEEEEADAVEEEQEQAGDNDEGQDEVEERPEKRPKLAHLTSDNLDGDDDEEVMEVDKREDNEEEEEGSPIQNTTTSSQPDVDADTSIDPMADDEGPTPSTSQSQSQLLDLSLSPSPPLPRKVSAVDPGPKLRQITLDTTNASWAKASMSTSTSTSTSKGKEKAKGKNLALAKKHLSQFANPGTGKRGKFGRKNPYILDEATESRSGKEEEEGDTEDEEEGEGDDLEVDEEEEEEEEDELEEGSSQVPLSTPPTAELEDEGEEAEDDEVIVIDKGKKKARECSHEEAEEDDMIIIEDEKDSEEQLAHLAELDATATTSSDQSRRPIEVNGIQLGVDVALPFDLSAITSAWTHSSTSTANESTPATADEPTLDQLAAASIAESSEEAEAALSRIVSKDDFAKMSIVGQFNLGFIIARRKIGDHDDLFIIDQHASDEKYNFETLQAETVMLSQTLLQPRTLNLPSHDEITAMDNIEMLKLNGFGVLVDEDGPVGKRVKLVAQPVSKDTVFGVSDFEELLDLINSSSSGEVVRPSKTRKMFASRACRKSVMIGKALNVNQMTSIVRHMGGMDQPWACPHGRPTMRWLAAVGTSKLDKRYKIANLLKSYH